MGNCCLRSQSSESMNPPHGSTPPSPPPNHGSPLPSPPSNTPSPLPPPSHGSTPSSPSRIDTIKSIEEICKKEDQEQIGRLFTFIETQLHKMNTQTQTEAGSSSSEGWLTTIGVVTKLAAITMETISLEAERLSNSYAVKEMGSVMLKAVKGMGESHWAFIGLSVAAYAIESYLRVGSTKNECKELLLKILELAKDVKQYAEQIPDQEKVSNAVRTIFEGSVICLGYLKKGKFGRFWSAETAHEQLEKTKEQLRDVRQSLDSSVNLKNLRILRQLTRRVDQSPLHLLEFQPVGIEEQVEKVVKLMDMEGPQSALAVILCGFGGVGKSTLAASVVQSLDLHSTGFKFCRVVIDEQTADPTSHIKQLQKDIIYGLGGGKLDFQSPQDGKHELKKALEKKCSLLFIDNVVNKNYIQDLLPNDLSSSEQETKLRILITSREKNVIAELSIRYEVHAVESLCKSASRQLLSETIMKDNVQEDKDFDEESMITKVAHACKGVPLLLSIFGKHLRVERDKDSYQEALDVLTEGNLDRYRDEDLGKRVMFVYHKIEDEEVKEAFLDICTYFHGWEWNLVADIVDSLKLRDLERRMLLSRSGSGEVIVHDILRLMGMKMGRSTRFSNLDGVENVEDVKGVSLVKDNHLIIIQSTQLEAMSRSLRVLMLGDWVTLDGPPSHTAFPKLRYLLVGDINAFPFKDPSKLKELRVFQNRSKPGMNVSHLPSSLKRISHEVPHVECDKFVKLPFQNLSSLKSFIVKAPKRKPAELPQELHLPASLVDLHLNACKNLPKEIGHLIALESLILDRSDVERLPQGFGKLKKLKRLSMDYCSELAVLSEEFGTLSSLEVLSMKNCGNLRALPESLGRLCSLQTLELTGSNLQLLPESFGGLSSLQTLELEGFINLQLLPETFGELRIRSLKLHSLEKLHDLPNSFGNMPLLKDLSLESCDSLMSLPNSFVQLRMLETLKIIKCTKLSVLPEDFCQLRCLKDMTVIQCQFLKELPRGFGALPALKTFELSNCNSFVNLPGDFGDLTSLESLHLWTLPLMSRIPDGFGKLKKLRKLYLGSCFQLKTLSDDFENMASLERLDICDCPELDGAMIEKILKLQNCFVAYINGSRKLSTKWEHMRGETEHPIAVFCRRGWSNEEEEEEEGCALMVALLRGKCVEVKNPTEPLMERSSLLVGLEEGKSAMVALIMLPIHIESHQSDIVRRFVEMARETAKANGSGELQIVCASKVDLNTERERRTPTEEEERAKEEDIRQILLSLPKGSAAIPSTESKRVKILTFCCEKFSIYLDKLSFFMATVVDVEGRKRFENLKFMKEYEMREHPPSEIREPKSTHYKSIQNFIQSIPHWESESERVAGGDMKRELMEALKGSGIDYLPAENNTSKVQEMLEPRGRYPLILEEGRGFLTQEDHEFLQAVGFGGGPFIRHIQRDYPLLVALMERWDPEISAFRLPPGPMTITVEDLHRLFRLPIRGDRITTISDMSLARQSIGRLFGGERVEAVMESISSRGILYYRLWSSDETSQQELLRVSYLIGLVLCYGLPDASGGRFPWSLIRVIDDMITHQRVFAWAPTLLAQIYRELFLWSTTDRSSISVTIALQAWAYEHIAVARPLGLPDMQWQSVGYPVGVRRWADVFVMRRTERPRRDVAFYREMLDSLHGDQVRWRIGLAIPNYPETPFQIYGIRQGRVLSGRRPSFLEYFQYAWVTRHFGVVQAIPPPPRRFLRSGAVAEDGLAALAYSEPDLRAGDPFPEDEVTDDVGTIKWYPAWWAVELERAPETEGVEPDVAPEAERLSQRCRLDPDIEPTTEEGLQRGDVEGGVGPGAGPEEDVLPIRGELRSVDSLLEEIEGTRYLYEQAKSLLEMAQGSAEVTRRHEEDRLRYRAERDRYRFERDAARLQLTHFQQQAASATPRQAWRLQMEEMIRERDYYRSAVEQWLPGFHPYIPGRRMVPVRPPLDYTCPVIPSRAPSFGGSSGPGEGSQSRSRGSTSVRPTRASLSGAARSWSPVGSVVAGAQVQEAGANNGAAEGSGQSRTPTGTRRRSHAPAFGFGDQEEPEGSQ